MFDWLHAIRRSHAYYVLKKAQKEEVKLSAKTPYKEIGTVHMQGVLTKQGGKWKSWNKRYCVLGDTAIWYFKDKGSGQQPKPDDKAEGGVPLKFAFVSTAGAEVKTKRTNALSILTQDRVYFLACASDAEEKKWLAALQVVCAKVNNQQTIDFSADKFASFEDAIVNSHIPKQKSESKE
jgi:hypothetical protein